MLKKNQTQHFIKFGPPDVRSALRDKSTSAFVAFVALLARDKRVLEGTNCLSGEIIKLVWHEDEPSHEDQVDPFKNAIHLLLFSSTPLSHRNARFSKHTTA